MENCDRLFVYGTLRKGFENQYTKFLLKHNDYLGNGYFFGQLYDVGHYPGAVYDPACDEKVFGDIFLLHNKEEVLKMLDTYEGVGEPNLSPYEYKREIIFVYHNRQVVSCWTYLYNHPVHALKKISSGDYFQYHTK